MQIVLFRFTRCQVETILKTLTLSDYDWRKTWESVQKLTGKIKLLYSYLDGYLSAPDQVSQIALGTHLNAFEYISALSYLWGNTSQRLAL